MCNSRIWSFGQMILLVEKFQGSWTPILTRSSGFSWKSHEEIVFNDLAPFFNTKANSKFSKFAVN